MSRDFGSQEYLEYIDTYGEWSEADIEAERLAEECEIHAWLGGLGEEYCIRHFDQ